MSDHRPRVSIGLPVYNGEPFLAQALDSILGQTFEDFEVIVSDNASADRTEEICRAYAGRDSRVRYERSPDNRGASWNHNHTFRQSRGQYFKWASHDDLLAPEYLDRCVQALDGDRSVALSQTRTRFINAAGEDRGEEADLGLRTDAPEPQVRFRDLICSDHFCYQIFGVFRADVLRQTPLLGAYASADRVLLARVGLLGRFHEVADALFCYRSHAGQSTRIFRTRQARAAWFDPAAAGRVLLPEWRIFVEYTRAVWETPLSPRQRAACAVALMEWWKTNRNWARMGRDLIRAVQDLLRLSGAPGGREGRGAVRSVER